MRHSRIMLAAATFIVLLSVGSLTTLASQFVVFPKASELVSPDGRFAVRSVDASGAASDIVGTFHALWLYELPQVVPANCATISASLLLHGPAMTFWSSPNMWARRLRVRWFFPWPSRKIPSCSTKPR